MGTLKSLILSCWQEERVHVCWVLMIIFTKCSCINHSWSLNGCAWELSDFKCWQFTDLICRLPYLILRRALIGRTFSLLFSYLCAMIRNRCLALFLFPSEGFVLFLFKLKVCVFTANHKFRRDIPGWMAETSDMTSPGEHLCYWQQL